MTHRQLVQNLATKYGVKCLDKGSKSAKGEILRGSDTEDICGIIKHFKDPSSVGEKIR
jgi:hypothetical protein